MIKSNKKNVIISALLSIVMCISLIVGVTLAIATSDSKVNIAITGAKIDVVATVDETSVQKKQLNTEYAADGSTYSGEVEFDGGTVSLKNFVAGDGVKFNIIVKNNSTVTVNYRTVLAIGDYSGLFESLNVTVDGETFDGNTLYSSWRSLKVGTDGATIAVEIELPANATDFSGKTCDLMFAVEAVQGNAEVSDDGSIIYANVTKTVDESETTYFYKANAAKREACLIAPAGSLSSGEYTFNVASKLDGMVKAAENRVCYSYDIQLLDSEGNVVSANEGTEFTIELLLFEAIQNVEVYHNGTLIAEPTVTSDNHISFNTASFSTFDVVFDAPVAKVNGENYYTLSSAVYASGLDGYITILRDFTSDGATMNAANRKLTLDLNGHTITFNENERFKLFMGELTVTGKGTMQEAVPNYAPISVTHKASYPAVVSIGKDVTLKGWTGILVNPKNAYNNSDYGLEINIDGTLIGMNDVSGSVGAGLYINGANVTVDPAITVNISETAVLEGTGHGLYGAGYAVYNTCGTITGGHTGVEIRAGQLNVTGGTITGNGVPTEVEGNGSGATTIGAGIAVAQHTTKLPTELNVTGGVINGYTALNQSNPQNNDDESVAKVKLSVSGGTFNVINGGTNAVYSENFTGFITGGTFINFDPSTMPSGASPSYVKVGYSVVSESKNGNVWYTVIEGVSTASANVTVDETNKTTEEVKIVSEGKIAGNAAAKATIPVGTKVTAGATALTLSIADAEVPEGITVEITQNAPKALNIHMAGLAADNDKLIKVEFHIEKGLSLVEINHNGIKMDRCGAMKWLDADQEFYYDAATGLVTMLTKNFSTFTYTSDKFYWDDEVKDAKHTYGTPVDTTNKIITVASAKDLALFKYEVTDKNVDYNGYTLNITADIDLGLGYWRPINPVKNLTINGNGHTISNLLVRSYTHHDDKSGDYGFGFIANATGNLTIKNLSFDGANVAKSKGAETRYSGNVGGIVVAYAYGTTLFENVTVTNSTIYGYGKIGCILGMGAAPGISVTFKNCVSKDNSIYGATNLGGLAGNIQRGNGVDNGKVENCTVENITVNYDPNTYYGYYVDLENVNATYKSNDTADGEDVIRSVTGKWYVRDGYYWGTYGDYYVSYGNSSYDAPVDGHTEKIANSEYCVNKAN